LYFVTVTRKLSVVLCVSCRHLANSKTVKVTEIFRLELCGYFSFRRHWNFEEKRLRLKLRRSPVASVVKSTRLMESTKVLSTFDLGLNGEK
jgi:hypothetical protein